VSIRIIALGTRMPAWVNEGFAEYVKRMPRDWAVELVELKADRREGGRTTARSLAIEAERVRASWVGCHRVALDERGKALTTAQLAQFLLAARERAGRIAFAIGSADGLDPSLKSEAETLISLSALTLPHGLVRVILAEQIYRAVSLLQGHPYHRE